MNIYVVIMSLQGILCNIFKINISLGEKKVFERNRCKYLFLPRMSFLLLNYIVPTRVDHLIRMCRHYTC